VGCDYPSKKPGLNGAVNDCFLLADCLHRSCGFLPEDICILHDRIPGQAKSSERLVDAMRRPNRANILQRLQWLARGAKPGDVLFFSFSGYGLQVDDLRTSQGEGFDEAILPSDFADGCDGDPAVITTVDIHDALMGIPQGCSLTVVMDCDHGTSVVDVSGTLDGHLLRGLKQNTCGVSRHTTKMQLAEHNEDIWLGDGGPAMMAAPRFLPMIEVANPGSGRMPTRQLMSRSTPVAFCYSAAGHGETALELQVARSSNGWDGLKQHGALSWCFVQALEELRCDCTHAQLQSGIHKHMARLRDESLPRMDQQVLLTFSLPLSDPHREKVLRPMACGEATNRSQMMSARTTRSYAPERHDRTGSIVPAIVPPPPPGFLQKSSSCAVPLEAGYLPSPLATMGLSVWRAAWSGALDDDDADASSSSQAPPQPVTREPTFVEEVMPQGHLERARPVVAGSIVEVPESIPAQSSWQLAPAPMAVASKSDSASTCSTRSRDGEDGFGSESDFEEASLDGLGALLPAGLGEWARRMFGAARHQEQGRAQHGLCASPYQRPAPMGW